MTLRGHIQRGAVVLEEPAALPDGTPVEVRTLEPAVRPQSTSLDDLARQQGVAGPASFDTLLGGWPEGEEGDGFEDAVTRWRADEPRRGEF
jgi:hypothetical protein